jgi:hypothetical protein
LLQRIALNSIFSDRSVALPLLASVSLKTFWLQKDHAFQLQMLGKNTVSLLQLNADANLSICKLI